MILTIDAHLLIPGGHMRPVHCFIQTVMFHQFLMRAGIIHQSVPDDAKDPVGIPIVDSRWAMTISVLPSVSRLTER